MFHYVTLLNLKLLYLLSQHNCGGGGVVESVVRITFVYFRLLGRDLLGLSLGQGGLELRPAGDAELPSPN